MLVFPHPLLEEGKVSTRLPGVHKPSAFTQGPGISPSLDLLKKKKTSPDKKDHELAPSSKLHKQLTGKSSLFYTPVTVQA